MNRFCDFRSLNSLIRSCVCCDVEQLSFQWVTFLSRGLYSAKEWKSSFSAMDNLQSFGLTTVSKYFFRVLYTNHISIIHNAETSCFFFFTLHASRKQTKSSLSIYLKFFRIVMNFSSSYIWPKLGKQVTGVMFSLGWKLNIRQ